jgi:hypothetical protein
VTIRYVGLGGDDGNSGLTWALRKLTLNGVENTPVAAGDLVYVGPGVYRELLTCDVDGGNLYYTGTVTVTQGSAVVTGSGTTFTGGGVVAGYVFSCTLLANGTDGVTDGTSAFTSAAGNFQASMVGSVIQIDTKNAYYVAGYTSATAITLGDPNTLGWPSAGSGLSYSIMSGEEPYEVASVDSATQLTLTTPWRGITAVGAFFLTWNPITYVGDVTGEHTDGVGGIVRITGSDDDQSTTRNVAIYLPGRSYRTFRGFLMDLCTQAIFSAETNPVGLIVEDCSFRPGGSYCVYINGTGGKNSIRRCVFNGYRYTIIVFSHATGATNTGNIVANCLFHGGATAVLVTRVHTTIKNCTVLHCVTAFRVDWSVTIGQVSVISNCILEDCGTGIAAKVRGEFIENYNSLFGITTLRSLTDAGANSNTYPALFDQTLLVKGYQFPGSIGALSEWSQLARIAGLREAGDDLFGVARPTTASKKSWGAVQLREGERDTATKRTGDASLKLADAGDHQMFIPTDGSEITVSTYTYFEADYTGTKPQLIMRQPGASDQTDTATGAVETWEQLSITLTPNGSPGYVVAILRSNNTQSAGDYATYFDDLDVS